MTFDVASLSASQAVTPAYALDASPSAEHEILLNVRALTDPDALRATVGREFSALPARLEWQHTECFRPSAPVPYYRE